ncbi:MAG: hypothetical protein AAF843_06840 [Bacteroidota bacterium]
MPGLSDDIYRFVWDGKLLHEGIHPFSHVPSWFIANNRLPDTLNIELYNSLNSPDYFTIYPPVGQFLFWVSAFSDSVLGSAIIMRIFIFVAELGSIYLLLQLSDAYNLSKRNVLIYALNPLVILELTGNLHLESLMIFFLLLGIYSYKQSRYLTAGSALALAIASKLIPLIILPVFLRRISIKRLCIVFVSTGLMLTLVFWPLYDPALIEGMSQSISLYFQKFEFNASLYYLIREIGFLTKGYNIIETAGPWLSVITFIIIMSIALFAHPKKDGTPAVWLWIFLIYFAMATIVHPWYVTALVALCTLTHYRFPMLWSALIFLSYLGYSETGFEENMLIVALEYSLLLIFVIYEIRRTFHNRRSFKTTII